MQHQNRYPTVAANRDTVSPLFPAYYTYGAAEKNLTAAFVVISRRYSPAASFRARSVTVDLWRTRGVQTMYTAAKVIPGKSLGSLKAFSSRGMSTRGKSPRFTVAIRRIVSRHSFNITSLGHREGIRSLALRCAEA